MKKLFLPFILLAVILSISFSVSANNEVSVYIDNKMIEFDVVPQIIDGRTMVPMRKIFEEMGTVVEWDGDTQTVTASNNLSVIKATIGKNIMTVNGTPKTLDVSPQLVDSRTLVPARFVAEALGANVEWESSTSSVFIERLSLEEDKSLAEIDSYTYGFEKAEFSKYNSPASENGLGDTAIYLNGVLTDVEYMDTESGEIILGYITDEDNNAWLSIMHTTSLVGKRIYARAIGKQVTILGIYGGFSEVKKMPSLFLYELRIDDSGETIDGLQKILYEDDFDRNAQNDTVIMYTIDGKTKVVPAKDVENYKKLSWYSTPTYVLYSVDGNHVIVSQKELESYQNNGWYLEPVVIMYAADGRTQYVEQSKVEEQKHGGWYLYPVVTMYSPEGATIEVAQLEIEAYKNVGWYLEPVITMYATDGKTIVVKKSDSYSYERQGWYESKEEALLGSLVYDKTKTGSLTGVITYQYNDYVGTRADVGAKVLLMQINHIPTNKDESNIGGMYNIFGDPTVYSSEVDGFGHYYFDNVPAGKYFLLILSKETNQSPAFQEINKRFIDSMLGKVISTEACERLKLKASLYSFEIQTVVIHTIKYHEI